MDKTPKYLKMCEGAFKDIGIIDDGLSWVNPEKIQNLWARLGKDGKYYRITQATIPEAEGWFQVYYQDQLQNELEKTLEERLKKNNKYTHAYREYPEGFITSCILAEFYYWEAKWRGYWLFASMEQLWLGFIMKENFQEVWNNEKWEINYGQKL